MGYLEEQGYAFSCQSGSGCLRITKEVLVVKKEQRLSNNLYRMEGSVVSDIAEVLVVAQEDQFVYKLWHYRMGHLSDRGLTKLSRRGNILVLKKDGNDLCEPCIFGK